jgi:hypothetical protein
MATVRLRDKDTGAALGNITEEQLRFLQEQLEEESAEDTDYYINTATLEMLEDQGADPALLDVLRKGLGEREDMEVQWQRE